MNDITIIRRSLESDDFFEGAKRMLEYMESEGNGYVKAKQMITAIKEEKENEQG